MSVIRKVRDAKGWANLLVDNVAMATQLDPEKGELPNVEEWRRNAEQLFEILLKRIQEQEKNK